MNDRGQRFVFDEWKELAARDPEAFERRRERAIRQLIEQAPDRVRRRLEGLQWKVDLVRRRSRDPQQSCARLFSMMWDSVYGEGGLLSALQLEEGAPLKTAQPDRGGDVLAFRAPQRRRDKQPVS